MSKEYSRYLVPSLKDAKKRINRQTIIHHFKLDEKYLGLGNKKTYYIKTYGCQGNLADSEKIAGILKKLGYQPSEVEETSDVVVYNTCAIRENAENRVFGELGRTKKYKKDNPDSIICLCGCMAQEEKVIEKVKKICPQVDIIFGTHNIFQLPELLYEVINKKSKAFDVLSYEGDIVEDIPVVRDHNKKAWVNIMYGCDEFCTYCIVPYTRGRERSRLPEDIINEVKTLADEGYQEVTLLGQNVNAYGKDLGIDYTFSNLLTDLNKINIPRIRFTTSHPRDFDDQTIEAFALGGNIMPYLHLPVQSGSNTILKKMNRKYTKEEYLDKINKLRLKVPNISITTDIIVGFPNETDEDFQETLDLVEKCQFEGAYTFIFSPREGTPAFSMEDPISEEIKKERLYKLNKVINEGYLRGNKRFEGTIQEVLVDGVSSRNDNVLTGYTPNNKVVNFVGDKELIGKIVNVKIEKAFSWHLRGKLI